MGAKKRRQRRPYRIQDTLMSPAQQLMRRDAAAPSVAVDRKVIEGIEASKEADIVRDILEGNHRLKLHPSDWAQVRMLVRAGVKAGRKLERER
jgi:hypothetical protein